MRPEWWPDWEGECAAIVAAGPSVRKDQVELLKDRIHVVAINTSYELCPWADALYGCDAKWWASKKGVGSFKGIKIAMEDEAVKQFPELKQIKVRYDERNKRDVCHDFLMDKYGEVGGGGNSGFQALNWLAQLGVKAVALLGFDFRIDGNGKIHWHGRHADSGHYILHNPSESNFRLWIEKMNKAVPRIRALEMDVVNCSETSALECFPKMSVEDALRRWGL